MNCPFHLDCSLPCPIEDALHRQIQAEVPAISPLARAAMKRAGQIGGYHGRQKQKAAAAAAGGYASKGSW